jgi:hypothetical protein
MILKSKNIVLFLFGLFSLFNILLIDFKIGFINVRYLIFFSLIIVTFFLYGQKILSSKNINFFIKVFCIAGLLLFLSLIIKGNLVSNAMWFINPYLVFLLIPVFNVLFSEFSPKKIIKLFVVQVYLLSFYFLFIAFCLLYKPDIANYLAENHDLTKIIIQESGYPRIFIKTCPFFIPAVLYHFLYHKSLLIKILLIILTLIQILILFTYGLFFGVFVVIILYLLYKKKYILFISVSAVVLFVSLSVYINRENLVQKSKLFSINTKISQFEKGLVKSSVSSFLFGDGIGAPIKDLDSRNLKDDFVIEVAPVMLYIVGGIFGSLLLLYIYLWYPLKGFFHSCKIKNNELAFLCISQIGIITASFTNPYIWSGGMGIFFVAMIISLTHKLNLNETKIR